MVVPFPALATATTQRSTFQRLNAARYSNLYATTTRFDKFRSSPSQSPPRLLLYYSHLSEHPAEPFMYAIFEDGSRQYRVSEGDLVRVDYREAAVGTRIEFGRVLLCANEGDVKVGQPTVDGTRVLGT